MKNVYFKESNMNEREVLLYIKGFLKGVGYDPEGLMRENLLDWDVLITEALFGDDDEN